MQLQKIYGMRVMARLGGKMGIWVAELPNGRQFAIHLLVCFRLRGNWLAFAARKTKCYQIDRSDSLIGQISDEGSDQIPAKPTFGQVFRRVYVR